MGGAAMSATLDTCSRCGGPGAYYSAEADAYVCTAMRCAYAVKVEKGRAQLPEAPDSRTRLAWLTVVLALDRNHPVTGGRHLGARGGGGIVELNRLSAPTLEFDPASVISNGQKLREALTWSERLE